MDASHISPLPGSLVRRECQTRSDYPVSPGAKEQPGPYSSPRSMWGTDVVRSDSYTSVHLELISLITDRSLLPCALGVFGLDLGAAVLS